MSSELQNAFAIVEPYEIARCPDWVTPAQVVSDQPAADAPWSISLLDYQLRASDQHHTEFRRMRQWVMDESKIEDASQFLFEILPGAQRLVIHRCVIVRDGKTIEALDVDNIRMMQRDNNLENHMTSNRVTIELTIDDLRIGDLVEIETSEIELRGEHPLYGHFLRSFFWCRWSVPVANQSLRVINDSTDTLTNTARNRLGTESRQQKVYSTESAIQQQLATGNPGSLLRKLPVDVLATLHLCKQSMQLERYLGLPASTLSKQRFV